MTEEVGRVLAGASHICCEEHKRAFSPLGRSVLWDPQSSGTLSLPGPSVLRDTLTEVRLVITDAADNGGEAEEAGGRQRLTVF